MHTGIEWACGGESDVFYLIKKLLFVINTVIYASVRGLYLASCSIVGSMYAGCDVQKFC